MTFDFDLVTHTFDKLSASLVEKFLEGGEISNISRRIKSIIIRLLETTDLDIRNDID
jgi:hypothetical protein